ncbi:hypothetical protein Cgig2_010934 [Carnegiea gigantea]|uniref:Uncharacterized protein n=1 Tax=Carnegiea gigantea TaxID=171969 RepID=A0A9Q1GVZ0_9CARY|nr:hypothetical protein Cgig2_010934 [Carnegiea gigantea]
MCRQGAAGSRGHRADLESKGARESRAIPAPDANAELKRQAQCNSKSRSEKFSSHQEEVASAFPIEPPRVSQAMEESGVNGQGHPYKRASHSGLLVHQRAWSKGGKNLDDAPTSGPLSTRSMLSEDNRDKSGSLRRVAPKLVARFPGSFKETSASINGQDQMHHLQGLGSSHQNEGPSISTKDPVVVILPSSSKEASISFGKMIGCESKGKKIHYSGPLVVPSGNVDQILKDHDHQVQEAVRRARIDEARLRKMQAERSQPSTTLVSDTGL